MRAAVMRNSQLVVDTVPDPEPGRGRSAGEDAGVRHLRIGSARPQARRQDGGDGARRPARRSCST